MITRHCCLVLLPTFLRLIVADPADPKPKVVMPKAPAEEWLSARHPDELVQTAEKVKEGPGGLRSGGYTGGDVSVSITKFRGREKTSLVEVDVEILEHAPDYQYAVTDLYAALGQYNLTAKLVDSEVPAVFRLFERESLGGGSPNIIAEARRGPEKEMRGVVGWHTRRDSKTLTVFCRFEYLRGLPLGVIDDFLTKYPSAIKKDDPAFLNWNVNEVKKWMEIIRSGGMTWNWAKIAHSQLQVHDRESFGIITMSPEREGDPIPESKWKEDVTKRMETWLRDHPPRER